METDLRSNDPTRVLAARLRTGDIHPTRLVLAGHLGYQPAADVAGIEIDFQAFLRIAPRNVICYLSAELIHATMPDWVYHFFNTTEWIRLTEPFWRYDSRRNSYWIEDFEFTPTPTSPNNPHENYQIARDRIKARNEYYCQPATKRMCQRILNGEPHLTIDFESRHIRPEALDLFNCVTRRAPSPKPIKRGIMRMSRNQKAPKTLEWLLK